MTARGVPSAPPPPKVSKILSIFLVQHFCQNLGGYPWAPPNQVQGVPLGPPVQGVSQGQPPKFMGYPWGCPPSSRGYPKGHSSPQFRGVPPQAVSQVQGVPLGVPPSLRWVPQGAPFPQVQEVPPGLPPPSSGGTPRAARQVQGGGGIRGAPHKFRGYPRGAPQTLTWGAPGP